MEKISGIYYIKNFTTGKLYIGQSIDIYKEWDGAHKPALKYNRHHNKYLQRAWNKYGESDFEHGIIKVCSEKELDYFEIYYINAFASSCAQKGYNISLGGESVMRGRNHTDRAKEKMSLSKRNMTEKTKEKMRNSRIGKKLENSSSKHHGVQKRYANKNKNIYWRTGIMLGGKYVNIGNSKNEIEAAIKYNEYIIANNIPYPLNIIN